MLSTLKIGDPVCIQDQAGNKPKVWSRTGTVVEVQEYDKYLVRVDGSGRCTLRNRRFLRPASPYKEVLEKGSLQLHRSSGQGGDLLQEQDQQGSSLQGQDQQSSSLPEHGRDQDGRRTSTRVRKSPDWYQACLCSTPGGDDSAGCPPMTGHN